MNLKRTKKGFTIVELVIVVGVIGILSAILIPTFVNLTDNAKKQAEQLTIRDVYTEYVAEASDGLVDGTNKEIKWVAQDKVEIVKDTKVYTWNESTSKWVGETGTPSGTLVVAGDSTASTFSGYTIYWVA